MHQTIDQATLAADHVQATFLLMLLENPVQAAFEFVHGTLPQSR
jgi:hypothetical protein